MTPASYSRDHPSPDDGSHSPSRRTVRGIGPPRDGQIIGTSRPIRQVRKLIQLAGPSDLPVLITGESGVGKELVARALHDVSGRRAFSAVNAAGLTAELLDAEMFGYVRGAFTGADMDKMGLFEAADGGTLFLDEVGDLLVKLQPKLLRALQGCEVRRVGSIEARIVDVRTISATNKDLEQGIQEGWMREDLFFRIAGFPIHVPPLRDRTEDIPLLARHFLNGQDVGSDFIEELAAYPWPGNIRELQMSLAFAQVLARNDDLRVEHLPERIRTARDTTARVVGRGSGQWRTLREFEREYVELIMRETNGNKSRAAEILGIDRKTLGQKLNRHSRRTRA